MGAKQLRIRDNANILRTCPKRILRRSLDNCKPRYTATIIFRSITRYVIGQRDSITCRQNAKFRRTQHPFLSSLLSAALRLGSPHFRALHVIAFSPQSVPPTHPSFAPVVLESCTLTSRFRLHYVSRTKAALHTSAQRYKRMIALLGDWRTAHGLFQ